jgi:hypothetical protein
VTPRQEMERRIVTLGSKFRAPDKLMNKMLVMAGAFVDGAMEEEFFTEEQACEEAVKVISQAFKEELPAWLIVDDGQHK